MKVVILQIQQQHWSMARFVFLVLLLAAEGAAAIAPPQIVEAGCNDKCGDTSVPYPFGIGKPSCCINEDFLLECLSTDQYRNKDAENRKERLWYGNYEIKNIYVENATATTSVDMAHYCYNNSNSEHPLEPVASTLNLTGGPFTFSSEENKFTAIGCDTHAFMADGMSSSGCMSMCMEPVNLTDKKDADCSGIGCCRTQIPKGVKYLYISLETFNNFSNVKDFSPCSFAFLADQDWYGFTSIDLADMFSVDTHMSPAVLDWVVGEDTCESFDLNSNKSYYACGENANCNNSTNGPGYICSCKSGYEGNPYLPQGCQGIYVYS
ncbi:hypothetical protein LguiA_033657 [Lonicera macranthoides]